eukprot:11043285-Lingulodinium_polyedra.AAC.1
MAKRPWRSLQISWGSRQCALSCMGCFGRYLDGSQFLSVRLHSIHVHGVIAQGDGAQCQTCS